MGAARANTYAENALGGNLGLGRQVGVRVVGHGDAGEEHGHDACVAPMHLMNHPFSARAANGQ